MAPTRWSRSHFARLGPRSSAAWRKLTSQRPTTLVGLGIAGANTAAVRTPEVVVGATGAADVAAAVRYARGRGLHVTAQSTGHGAYLPVTNGLLVSTRRLTRLDIDPDTRIATLGAGVRWGAVITAAAEHGLFPIAGSSPMVGVAGFLLGGGLGPLVRSHGYSSDYLQSATVVTGTADILDTSTTSHPDLFWALRGGKQGLGIVTELRLRLVPLTTLYGGTIAFAADNVATALHGWFDWTRTADPRVSTSVLLSYLPNPDTGDSRPVHGLTLRVAVPGPPDDGDCLTAPLRALGTVVDDTVTQMPARDIARIHNDPVDPAPAWIAGAMFTHADAALADQLLDLWGPGGNLPFPAAEIRHLGGAASTDVPQGSAATGRGAQFLLGTAGMDPATFDAVLPAAADRMRAALAPWLSAEHHPNFAGHPTTDGGGAAAWPADAASRLTAIRHRYDPDQVMS